MKCITPLQNKSLALHVYVQPRASKNRVTGMHGSAIKICVTAPPVDNKANEAVIQLIADLLGVSRSSVTIKSGHWGRSKTVLITNLALQKAQETLSRTITNT